MIFQSQPQIHILRSRPIFRTLLPVIYVNLFLIAEVSLHDSQKIWATVFESFDNEDLVWQHDCMDNESSVFAKVNK